MKAILASFHAEYCQLIASLKKSVEVRKTKPKLDVPFKVYMYETKSPKLKYVWTKKDYEGYPWFEDMDENEKVFVKVQQGRGKVIGEFICDRMYIINKDSIDWFYDDGFETIYFKDAKKIMGLDACLSDKQLKNYFGRFIGYGWHISDIVIYEQPKELREFSRYDNTYDNSFGYAFEDRNKHVPITRPPQSWCYVEELTL